MDLTFKKDWFNFILGLSEAAEQVAIPQPLRHLKPLAKSSVSPGTGISVVQHPGSILKTLF